MKKCNLILKTVCSTKDKPYIGYDISEAKTFVEKVRPYIVGKKLGQILIHRFYGVADYDENEMYFDYEYRHPVNEPYDGHMYYHFANWEGPLILKFEDIQFEARMWSSYCYELGVNNIAVKKIYNAQDVCLKDLALLKGEMTDYIDISCILPQLIDQRVVDITLVSAINPDIGRSLDAVVFKLENNKKMTLFNNDDFIDIDAVG